MHISVYRGSERNTTSSAERVTHHSFSFGDHYDPANLAFGPMRAHDDHRLSWGAGFEEHSHSCIELVTWVLHGQLVHTDSLGHRSMLAAGTLQVQSAGSGIRHSELADTSPEPTRFVQTWLVPDEPDGPPARFVASGMRSDRLVPVAGEGAQVPIGTAGATLWAGSPDPEETHDVPVCGMHHLFVASGAATLRTPDGEVELGAGDAARITDADEVEMTLRVAPETEVLLWTFRAGKSG
ncbi:pirin family protein [Nocardioides daphniae]|uniref:Pirin family protein n=1 Tax=Nocardioides daphniae TaxID=402297 RepID=A0A4P7U7N8_9ACTN|nr:pirin family protein [Nocardioides daphniae]QCC76162.1 pirin family protein [Nocardioides daphniae]GGD09451.1 quercetin 2,3-dioxygenase [Nocardioides daphniae]